MNDKMMESRFTQNDSVIYVAIAAHSSSMMILTIYKFLESLKDRKSHHHVISFSSVVHCCAGEHDFSSASTGGGK
jgi:hypothetical protein